MSFLRKFHVLAVDDKDANLISIEAVLNQSCIIEFAKSGTQALDILSKNANFDVILMDLQMPGLDGFETAREIKRIPECSSIPIIFVTAVYREDPFVKRGYAVGGVDYFTKPFDPEMLRNKVAIYGSFRQKEALLQERIRQLNESKYILRAGRTLSNSMRAQTVAAIVTDMEGRIVTATASIGKILDDPSIGKVNEIGTLLGWWDYKGNVIVDFENPVFAAFESNRTLKNEYVWITLPDGSRKNLLCSVDPLVGTGNDDDGAILVMQDVTESRQIEIELENRIVETAKIVS